MKSRILRWTIMLLIGLAIGKGMIYLKQKNEIENTQVATVLAPTAGQEEQQKTVPGPKLGGPFNLFDQNNKPVTQNDLKGKYTLIFFGFTFCPAICPTELVKMEQALDKLGADSEKIQPVFITTDPERDTPTVMKEYVSQFHPRLLGLTGSQFEIDRVTKSYHVYAKKVENEHMEGYMMDHSAFMYFMGPEGETLGIYRSDDTADFIVEDIKGKLKG